MLVLAMEFSRDRGVERPDVSGEARPRLVAGCRSLKTEQSVAAGQ